MSTRYFRLNEAVQAGHWSLGPLMDGQGQELGDLTRFTSGQPVQDPGRLKLRVRAQGRRRHFNLIGAGGPPVVHLKMANVFAEYAPAEVQLVPVDVKGGSGEYRILVTTRSIRCIDDKASQEVQRWKQEEGRPDKTGHYRSVVGLRIDPMRVGGFQVFRTWGWSDALIVSEHIKLVLERARLTGLDFEEV
ncbi:imm11 family protein [Corallococcus terminator]